MTPNDTDARDIVTRCEDALKRRDMLLEHKLLQEAVREMRATRAERDALRERVAYIDAAGARSLYMGGIPSNGRR